MRETIRVVAGVVVRGGRVLVAQRAPGMALAGHWEFPGGKVEAGESDHEALVRELWEELRIEVDVGPRVAESRHEADRRWLHLVAYRCRVVAGEPVAVEHTQIRWVTASELPSIGWAPADVALVAAVRACVEGG